MKLGFSLIKTFALYVSITLSFNSHAELLSVKEQIKSLGLSEPPKKVVCLSLNSAEILTILNERPLGFSKTNSGTMPYYLQENLKDVKDVGTLAHPSFERIQDLKPDLILVDRVYQYQSDVAKLSKIAPVINFRPDDYKDTMEQLKEFGKLFNKEKEAKNFIKEFNKESNNVKIKAKNHPTSVLAFFVTQNKIWAWTDQSFIASLLTEINLDYSYKGLSGKENSDFVEIGAEKVLEIDPDKLIVFEDPGKNIISYMEKNPVWKSLKAVKNKNVIIVDRDIWSRSRGPIAARKIVEKMEETMR